MKDSRTELVGRIAREVKRPLEVPRGVDGVSGIKRSGHCFLPLVALIATGAGECLFVGVDGEDTEADGRAVANGKRRELLGDNIAEDFIVAGVTLDNAAEAHDSGQENAVLLMGVHDGFGDHRNLKGAMYFVGEKIFGFATPPEELGDGGFAQGIGNGRVVDADDESDFVEGMRGGDGHVREDRR